MLVDLNSAQNEVNYMAKKGAVTGEQILFGILAYLGILVLIPLLAKKDDDFVHDHAKQGLMFLIVGVVWWFVSMIPVIGWFVVFPLGGLVLTIFGIWAIVNVIQGKQWTFPALGEHARKWNF